MEGPTPYDRYGWQSSLPDLTRSEPRVVRLHLERFVTDASPEQIRAWVQAIPWLQRECREFDVRDTAAREYTAILEYELPRDSRRPDVIVLERGYGASTRRTRTGRSSARVRVTRHIPPTHNHRLLP